MYLVELTYVSTLPKMGIQFYIGDNKAKGYVPQSGGMNVEHSAILAKIYLPDTKTHPMGILSGGRLERRILQAPRSAPHSCAGGQSGGVVSGH